MTRSLMTALLGVALAACGGGSNGSPDAGPGADAGPGVDAGPGTDGGPDAGPGVDAGNDAGPSTAALDSTTSTVTVDRTSVVANGTDAATITVTTVDTNGKPIPGLAVTLAVSGSSNVFIQPPATNASGVTTTKLTSTTPETKTISAAVATSSGSVTLTSMPTVSFVMAAPGAVATATLVASPVSAPADGATKISLTLTAFDANGTPVPSAMVSLSAPGAGDAFTLQTGMTNGSGVFTSALSSTTIGGQTVTATVGSAMGTADVTFTAVPGSCSTFTVSPSSAPVGSSITLTMTVLDANCDPIANAGVTFSATGTTNSLSPTTATTDANGVAVAQLTSMAPQTETVTATAMSIAKMATVTFTPVPSTSKSTLVASPTTAPADGSTQVGLTLTVLDGSGNPIPSLMVTLAATGAGASLDQSDGSTAADGTFQTTLTSTTQGVSTVTASAGSTTIATTTVTFTIAPCSTLSFHQTILGAGTNPWAAATGDFNKDGKLDFVVANTGGNTVSVFLNGASGFGMAAPYGVGANPYYVAVADLNGDQKLDLVTGNSGDGTVSVLIGNGDGTFKTAVPFPANSGPWGIVADDFNGDHKVDLIVSNYNTSTLSILLGNGDGTFGGPTSFDSGKYPWVIVAADVDGDTKLDVVVANNTSTVSVLYGNGDGTFAAPSTWTVGSDPVQPAVGDFDGDHLLDLAVADTGSAGSGDVTVLLNDGMRTFGTGVPYTTSGPEAVIATDIDGDGNLDLLFSTSTSMLGIFLGNGDGTFGAEQDFTSGPHPYFLAAGDFNGDGYQDLVIPDFSDGTVSLLINTCTP